MKEPPQQVSESVRKLNPHLYGSYAEKVAKFGQAYVDEFCGPPPTHAKATQGDSVVVGGTKTPKRIRQSSKPILNALEKEFQVFVEMRTDLCLLPQSIRFMLGNGIWYKPDFVCFEPKVCYEIKGPHAFRGGFENLKVAANKYPQFTWKLMWKEGQQWKEQVVLP